MSLQQLYISYQTSCCQTVLGVTKDHYRETCMLQTHMMLFSHVTCTFLASPGVACIASQHFAEFGSVLRDAQVYIVELYSAYHCKPTLSCV